MADELNTFLFGFPTGASVEEAGSLVAVDSLTDSMKVSFAKNASDAGELVGDEAIGNENGAVNDSVSEEGVVGETAEIVFDPSVLQNLPVLDRSSQAHVERLLREADALDGRRSTLIAREVELTKKVAMSKGVLALKKEMEGALEGLQKRAHERSVGSFERMLTAIAQDVQKGTQTEIKLELTTESSMPGLDIHAMVGGKQESVTSGALTNLISMGLRFITLARSGRARFMLLDESDCFIESGDVQNFFNVIDQLSRDAGIQTVCITHHDMTAFEERFRIYKLAEVDSHDKWPRRIPELVSKGVMEPSSVQEGYFSFIEAENFESYTKARIDLSPGVTVITGKNGRGKSAWARMLRANFLGKASDDNIRHDKTATTVNIGFSDGRVLSHTRKSKGAPKGEYVLHTTESYEYAKDHPGTWKRDEGAPRPLHHTETARLPDWVAAETGVADVDGINVALWGQLTPVFMLDEPPSKRASLLSIGRESGHLFAMNEVYKEDVRNAASTVKEGEKEIAAIRIVTKTLEPLTEIIPQLEASKIRLEELIEEAAAIKQAEATLNELLIKQSELAALQIWSKVASGLPGEPVIERTEGLDAWFERLGQAQEAIALVTDLSAPEKPQLFNETQGSVVLGDLVQAMNDAALLGKMPPVPVQPVIEETSVGQDIVDRTDKALKDSQIPRLEALVLPGVLTTHELSQWFEMVTKAQAECAVPVIKAPALQKVDDTRDLGQLIEEISKTRELVTGCKAQSMTLEAEVDKIDKAIVKATGILGAQWNLPADRIQRLAEQVTQSTNNTPGGQTRVVCNLDALEKQIASVAKEGYSHGLTEGLSRSSVVVNKKWVNAGVEIERLAA